MTPDWTDTQWEDAHAWAMRRASGLLVQHDASPTSRRLAEGREVIGAYGEIVWARSHGLPDPKWQDSGSDGGKDFMHRVHTDDGGTKRVRLDVKTSAKGDYLLVPVKQVRSDVYVLAHYVEPQEAYAGCPRITFRGWALASDIRDAPTRRFHSQGPINHNIKAENLRPMKTLERRLVAMEVA